ncbi:MAG: hypothetical protein WB677_23375, partial [Xanthobacteraceae bacterium]
MADLIDRVVDVLNGDDRFLQIEKYCRALSQRAPTHIRNRIEATHCFFVSPADILCTSDREIPNSRAIRDGVTPALNAAHTAFS